MAKNSFFIININSFTISITGIDVCDHNVKKFYVEKKRYEGIKNNFFKNPESLYFILHEIVEDCRNKTGRQIKKVYIILPQRFFRTRHNVLSVNKNSDKAINKFDVEDIINDSRVEIDDCIVLDCIPIAYKIEDDYVDSPLDLYLDKLEIISSSIGILSKVHELFIDISKKINAEFVFVPVFLPLLNKLQSDYDLNRSSRIVILFNEASVNVCYCEMRAVIATRTVDMGQNDIINAICALYKLNFSEAEELFNHINFNVSEGNYVINHNKTQIFDIKSTNESIKQVIEIIADKIKAAISQMIGETSLQVYIVGEKLCEIKGFDAILSKKLDLPLETVRPDLLLWTDSKDYPLVGLIETRLLKTEENNE